MLSKDPAPENLEEEGADDNGEISEKTAGVSFKDEDEVEEEPAADGDDEDGEGSSGKRESFEEDEEDNTLSLAAMEELLKPDALEKFANITKSFKAFSKLQEARLEALSGGEEFPAASEKKYHKCAKNSPRRSRACSSTAPRSNIWSTSSTAITAA